MIRQNTSSDRGITGNFVQKSSFNNPQEHCGSNLANLLIPDNVIRVFLVHFFQAEKYHTKEKHNIH